MSGWLDERGSPAIRDAVIRSAREMIGGVARVTVEVNPLEDIVFNPGAVAVFGGFGEHPTYLAIASAPQQLPLLEFFVGNPDVAAQFTSRVGQAVRVQFPVGRGYPLDDMGGKPVVLIGMGSGIAPLRSALLHMLDSPERFPRIALLHGATREVATPFAADWPAWEEAGVRVVRTVSQESPGRSAIRSGRVQSHFKDVVPADGDCWVILCGSLEMIVESRECLAGMGVAPERVVSNGDGD